MANAPKMKIPIGADTADFEKGARKVKQEMRDLSQVSSNALSAIGDAFGVDLGKVQQFVGALKGLDRSLNQTGVEGEKAFKSIATSITPVQAGIAGLGIAAAIAAFKQLNAEADAFESTIQGGIIKKQTDAYISTFRQAIRDQQGIGEGVSNFRSTVKNAAATMAGFFQSGFNFDIMTQAVQAGERASEIAGELYQLDLDRKNVSVQVAEIDAQIAANREIISDYTKSASERSAALAATQGLITDKLNLQKPLAEKQVSLLTEYNSLAATKMEDYDAEIAAKIYLNNLTQQEAAEQRSLIRQQKTINTLGAVEAAQRKEAEAAARKQAEALDKARKLLQGGGALESPSSSIATPLVPVEMPVNLAKPTNVKEWEYEIVKSLGPGLNIGIAFDVDAKKIHDVTKEIESLVENMATSVGEAVGELAANLINGEDAWSSFGNAALSAFGDMAVTVGKMAIATGTATLGIKAALESLNGWVAIAAGVALVALGSAVKAGLSNVASGNYSAGSGVATSTSTNRGTGLSKDYSTREMNVKVTGTLVGQGSSLVAVINNENNRRSHTT